jgi:hypothetical protein
MVKAGFETVPETGRLFLAVNDNGGFFFDNQGGRLLRSVRVEAPEHVQSHAHVEMFAPSRRPRR